MLEKEIEGDRQLLEKEVRSEEIFGGSLLDLFVDQIEFKEGGGRASREYVRHPGGVVIVPLLKSDQGEEILLVRQYRYPPAELTWELPAGTLEEGESRLECARRELAEETGHGGGKWDRKVDLFTSPGYSDEVLTLFIAEAVEPLGEAEGQESPQDEKLRARSFSVERILEMAGEGRLRDGKTLAGLFFLLHETL